MSAVAGEEVLNESDFVLLGLLGNELNDATVFEEVKCAPSFGHCKTIILIIPDDFIVLNSQGRSIGKEL